MPIKVAIFDDNQNQRDSLQYYISMFDDFQLVGAFPDCTEVASAIQLTKPDVVLMDIDMPEVSGIEAAKIIKSKFPKTIIIMQTVFEDDDKVFDSLKNGASGYLLKKTSPEKIVEAIRDAYEGGSPITPAIATKMLRYFQEQNQATTNYSLTDREKNILSLMVEGLSYKMIAEKESISFHTVNSHIRKIYEKLHVHSLGEAVSKALKENLI
ncbi:MAG: response regulator transcription factor [Flavobacteriales bacterium]